MIIQTEGLTKYYGKHRGIENVNLEVREGEVFGFLGPNGSGKTTTIRLLLNFLHPSSGSVRIFGMDSRKDVLKIHARTGYIPGELALYPNLTGYQTLEYLGNLRGGVEIDYLRSLAQRLEVDLSLKVKEYSSGNRHKIALIQAWMHRPDLLILDEPATGLDPLIRQQFYRMAKETSEGGQTLFLSSHNLADVEHVCDRVGIIRKGELIAVEEVDDLKARALRKVEISFEGIDELPRQRFAELSGVDNIQSTNGYLRFTVSGKLDPVVKAASEFEVVNFTSKEASLEEIFLNFYGDQAEQGH